MCKRLPESTICLWQRIIFLTLNLLDLKYQQTTFIMLSNKQDLTFHENGLLRRPSHEKSSNLRVDINLTSAEN